MAYGLQAAPMGLYPEIEPYDHGMLDVGDGNRVYWETAMLPAPPRSVVRYEDAEFRMGFARTVTHYWGNDHFLGPGNDRGVVLRDAHLLKDIPGTLVRGSLDPGNLLGTVWRLHHPWPGSELVLIDEVGHDAGAPGVAEALVAATDKYARR